MKDVPKDTDRQDLIEKEKARREEEEEDARDDEGFGRSEKASKAAQVNLSARLSSTKAQKNSAGFSEIWRLIKIARVCSMSLIWHISKERSIGTTTSERLRELSSRDNYRFSKDTLRSHANALDSQKQSGWA
jgi:hypothetical protein